MRVAWSAACNNITRLRLYVVKGLYETQRTSGCGCVIEMVSHFSFHKFNDQYLYSHSHLASC